jgi:hypothetical protein
MTNLHSLTPLRWLVVALLCVIAEVNAEHNAPAQASVASFSSASSQQVFKHWKPYRFSLLGASTHYQLAQQDGHQVLQAISNKTASGLIRNLTVSLTDHPILHWRWKITKLPTDADDHSQQGDDHSVRLYVIFKAPQTGLLGWLKNATGLEKTHALSYIWANQAPAETLLASPYTDRSIMIATNSGRSQLGQWVNLSRNVATDYQRAFGTSPPPVSAIAIMTDGDNTGSLLTSYYGDIYFARTPLPVTSQQTPLAQPVSNPLP